MGTKILSAISLCTLAVLGVAYLDLYDYSFRMFLLEIFNPEAAKTQPSKVHTELADQFNLFEIGFIRSVKVDFNDTEREKHFKDLGYQFLALQNHRKNTYY